MLAAMPAPIFSFSLDASSPPAPQYYHRPSVSSPLSSSPIRASSVSPPHHPLAPRDPNSMSFLRQSQSSPIKPQAVTKFKYANRNARPNPVVKRREDAQDGRRRLFLQNVRQRQEDEKWERRGGENELLKLEWTRLNRELRQAKESDVAGFITEEDLEDEPVPQEPEMEDADSMMLDEIEQQEQAEMEALLEALPTKQPAEPREDNYDDQGHFAQFSDDDDYDALFMELASSGQNGQQGSFGDDVEMS